MCAHVCLCVHVATRGLPQEHWPSTSKTGFFIRSWERETGEMRYILGPCFKIEQESQVQE